MQMCMEMMSNSMKNDASNKNATWCCKEFEKMGNPENQFMKDCMELMNEFCCISDTDKKSNKKQ